MPSPQALLRSGHGTLGENALANPKSFYTGQSFNEVLRLTKRSASGG
jgi:hypothetical protein